MKYLILGAGPAGLAFANMLMKLGQTSFLVLEKENEAGGLCRSKLVDNSPLDIGGGHFLDTKNEEVNNFLFDFMPREEWNVFERNSQIQLCNSFINHPIESNIWQMEIEDQVEYLKSIALAGCNIGKVMPINFVDWISWKLGDKIANEYMLPYNQKMFANDLNNLGTYWLEKLPSVSFEETLLSCINKKAYGKQPGHAIFLYPKKYGYGELWKRLSDKISGQISYNVHINTINLNTKSVQDIDGNKYSADIIINTIPWLEFVNIIGINSELKEKIKNLKYCSISTEYFSENMNTDAHWIYIPSLKLPYHRILVRHNFCNNSKGFWTETKTENFTTKSGFSYHNKYAYPLNTIDKPDTMNELLNWTKERNIYGLGRWGEHEHYNSDVTVNRAMNLAVQLESLNE